MKKCIIVSDSFKGTLSSVDICNIALDTIPKYFPDCDIIPIPVADGGEGTVDCLIAALDAKPIDITVSNPFMEPVVARYAVFGDTAIIEMASAAGLPLVGERKNPALTTTFGVGELIKYAVNNGAKNIYLGLGGSSTNDAGCGCAAALGVNFKNFNDTSFVPSGGTLKDIHHIDVKAANEFLKNINITIMSDVTNPLYGQNGAAYIFGPQKGADQEMVRMLDAGLENFSSVVFNDLKIDISTFPGGGAAGGMGAGIVAMLNGKITSGIDSILKLTGFEKELPGTDLVITGEGCLDDQSFSGKVISGVTSRTLPLQIPVYAIVGCIGSLTKETSQFGISAVFETNREKLPFSEVVKRAEYNYRQALEDAMRFQKIQERRIKNRTCY